MTIRTYILGLLTLIAGLVTSVGAVPVGAASNVLIVGLQTGSAASADAEYVRIANTAAAPLDVAGWRLQYRSATGMTWTTKATLTDSIAAGSTLLVTTGVYQTSDAHQTLTSGMTQAGGHVQLVDKSNVSQNLVGWGTAAHAQGSPAPAPQPDQALLRNTIGVGYQETGNNKADFSLSALAVTPPLPSPNPAPAPSPSGPSADGLTPPLITEMLPNPAAPQTDARDEFVELYNPNSVSFPLSGYKLQTGAKYSYSLSFTDQVLPANGYEAFTSGASSLTLSNTSGGARLLDPKGTVVDQTDNYGVAADGAAWAYVNDVWQWTTTPTPNAANVLTGASGPAPIAFSSSPAKTTTTPKAKTTAVKGAKTTKANTAKPGSTGANTAAGKAAVVKKPSPLHPLILAGVGMLALVYGVYEYRHDIANLVYKFRRNRAVRRAARQTP